MTTSWSRTGSDICRTALSIMGVQPAGQAVPAEDMASALDALDAVLKELPLYGYSWPKLSAETSLTWTGVQSFSLPTDYYGYPVVWSDGRRIVEMTTDQWNTLDDNAASGSPVSSFYIGPDGLLWVFPNPSADPVLTLQYQRLVSDATLLGAADMPQYLINTLSYGVAFELLPQYEIAEQRAQRIEKRWEQKLSLALRNAVSSAPISFSVADNLSADPSWIAPSTGDGAFDGGSP